MNYRIIFCNECPFHKEVLYERDPESSYQCCNHPDREDISFDYGDHHIPIPEQCPLRVDPIVTFKIE